MIRKKLLPILFMFFCLTMAAQQDVAPWALVRVSVANVREKPGHASELGSQVIMGTPLKVVSRDGDWYGIKTPEGYEGFVIANSLKPFREADMARWRASAERVVVTSVDQTYVYSRGDKSARARLQRLSDVVNGSILERTGPSENGYTPVRLPDGRAGIIKSADITPLTDFCRKDVDVDSIIDFAFSCMGVPYLWGGTSSKSMDCSGLTKIAFLSAGVILPRNASQQAKTGMPVSTGDTGIYRRGDLLFFGNPSTRRVNHVGLYIGGNRFIHCAGRVMVSSLDKNDSDYLKLSLLGVRRLLPDDFSRMALCNHSWYMDR